MKKSIIVVSMAAVLLLLVASCKKENSTSKVVLRAGIEDTPSKTHVDITGPWTNWKDTDHIMVNGNKMYLSKKYEGRPGVFDHADFTCDNWTGHDPDGSIQLYAVSPATQQRPGTNANTYESLISLPAVQPYIKNGFMDDLPMAVSNKGKSLNFSNLTCILGVPVRTAQQGLTITKVELTCADSQYPLVAQAWWPHWGQESLDLNAIQIDPMSSASRTITLDCGEGVTIPTDDEGIEFYFAAFPVLPKDSELDIKFYVNKNDPEPVATIHKTLSGKTEPSVIYDLVSKPDLNDRTPWTI